MLDVNVTNVNTTAAAVLLAFFLYKRWHITYKHSNLHANTDIISCIMLHIYTCILTISKAQLTASINPSIKYSHRWVNWGYSHFWAQYIRIIAHLILSGNYRKKLDLHKVLQYTHIHIRYTTSDTYVALIIWRSFLVRRRRFCFRLNDMNSEFQLDVIENILWIDHNKR